jgi:hypothetical protein
MNGCAGVGVTEAFVGVDVGAGVGCCSQRHARKVNTLSRDGGVVQGASPVRVSTDLKF